MRLDASKASAQRRSVNLAMSSRGLAALEFVDTALATSFLESAIPMKGRIIHSEEGTEMQVYDPIGGVSSSNSLATTLGGGFSSCTDQPAFRFSSRNV